jgi:hypothetical protein
MFFVCILWFASSLEIQLSSIAYNHRPISGTRVGLSSPKSDCLQLKASTGKRLSHAQIFKADSLS